MILGWLTHHRKVYIGQHRIHHGLAGAMLATIGVLLMLDDLFDFPWRTTD